MVMYWDKQKALLEDVLALRNVIRASALYPPLLVISRVFCHASPISYLLLFIVLAVRGMHMDAKEA